MPSRPTDHTGKKYGKLTMLYPVERGAAGRGLMWLAECECGRRTEIEGRDASRGRRTTCGNCRGTLGNKRKSRRRTPSERIPGIPDILDRYGPSWQLTKGFELTVSDIVDISARNCYCCDAPPEKVRKKGTRVWMHWHWLVRLVSTSSWTKENTVAICTPCKKLLGARNMRVFLEQVYRIYRGAVTRLLNGDSSKNA